MVVDNPLKKCDFCIESAIHYMKILHICIQLIFLLSMVSCKKAIEDQKKQAAMSFITNGQWKVENYLADTSDITIEFEGYKFKFNADGTVTGSNGTDAENGTWLAEVSDYSITSEFPGSGDPLKKLNGHWIIKDSGLTFVKADMTVPGSIMHLHLVKIP
jgi:hypothetical protein